MTNRYRVLGQLVPAANTPSTLYTVPAGNSAVISTISVCNLLDYANTTVSIAVCPGGAALSNQHYIAYNLPLPAADTIALTIGVTMAATDTISVSSVSGNVAFNLFGSEVY